MPDKRQLKITAQRVGDVGHVRIEGPISEYDKANARDLGWGVRDMVAAGVRDAHVYVDSEGGSVLEVKRILVQLRKFPGRVTGEGGPMVASAATYLGLKLDEFRVRPDTAYMIHKPSGILHGNEDQVMKDLKGLQDITKEYRALYAKKTGKTEEEIEALWSKGDHWLTGEEAVAQGFVDGLVEDGVEEVIDEDTVERIAACGCPKDKLPKAQAAPKHKQTMDIKATRALLGMPETATEAEVLSRIEALRKENERHRQAAAELRKGEIKAILDKAIADRKLTEAHRAAYEAKFNTAFDATKAEVEALVPAPSVAKEMRGVAAAGAAAGAAVERTYAEWAERDPKGLQAMMTSDPDKFASLYEAHYGTKPELPKV